MMENFICNDNYYSEISELINYQNWDKEEIESFPEDYKIEIYATVLEPIFKLDVDWIIDRIDGERFSENGYDKENDKIVNILCDNIDFDKINSLIPKLYYPYGRTYLTKQDLLENL